MALIEFVQASTIVILVLTIVLSLFLTREFMRKGCPSLLFWCLGLWSFVVGVLLEVLFAFGIYNGALANAYMVVVALLVQFLALGSIQLIKSKSIKKTYYWFCIASTIFLFYSVIVFAPANILSSYRVAVGVTSTAATIASLLITFPAAAILVIVALLSYLKTRNPKMLSIIAGVVVVTFAGTLYIVAVPVLLYYSEFIGIVLLWFGFFSFNMLKR